MECTAGYRHAFRTVLIIKLNDGTFKIHKVCSQCNSEKFPIWDARGRIIKTPAYKHSKEYREFLDNHNPAAARVAILDSDIRKVEQPHGSDNRARLRLVPKAQTRRRKSGSVKRQRDKQRA